MRIEEGWQLLFFSGVEVLLLLLVCYQLALLPLHVSVFFHASCFTIY